MQTKMLLVCHEGNQGPNNKTNLQKETQCPRFFPHIFLSTLLLEEQQLVCDGHVVHFYSKDCIISEYDLHL